jgi:hypothetical protein
LWLFSLYTFAYDATPDSLFVVDLLVVLLQLALFAGCVISGCWLLLRRDRGLGLGVLVGWAVGIIGLVLGTMLIFVTAPSDGHPSRNNTASVSTA